MSTTKACPFPLVDASGWTEDPSYKGYVTHGVLYSVVKDYTEEATLNRQPAVAAVIDKAKLPELIHEMTDP